MKIKHKAKLFFCQNMSPQLHQNKLNQLEFDSILNHEKFQTTIRSEYQDAPSLLVIHSLLKYEVKEVSLLKQPVAGKHL